MNLRFGRSTSIGDDTDATRKVNSSFAFTNHHLRHSFPSRSIHNPLASSDSPLDFSLGHSFDKTGEGTCEKQKQKDG